MLQAVKKHFKPLATPHLRLHSTSKDASSSSIPRLNVAPDERTAYHASVSKSIESKRRQSEISLAQQEARAVAMYPWRVKQPAKSPYELQLRGGPLNLEPDTSFILRPSLPSGPLPWAVAPPPFNEIKERLLPFFELPTMKDKFLWAGALGDVDPANGQFSLHVFALMKDARPGDIAILKKLLTKASGYPGQFFVFDPPSITTDDTEASRRRALFQATRPLSWRILQMGSTKSREALAWFVSARTVYGDPEEIKPWRREAINFISEGLNHTGKLIELVREVVKWTAKADGTFERMGKFKRINTWKTFMSPQSYVPRAYLLRHFAALIPLLSDYGLARRAKIIQPSRKAPVYASDSEYAHHPLITFFSPPPTFSAVHLSDVLIKPIALLIDPKSAAYIPSDAETVRVREGKEKGKARDENSQVFWAWKNRDLKEGFYRPGHLGCSTDMEVPFPPDYEWWTVPTSTVPSGPNVDPGPVNMSLTAFRAWNKIYMRVLGVDQRDKERGKGYGMDLEGFGKTLTGFEKAMREAAKAGRRAIEAESGWGSWRREGVKGPPPPASVATEGLGSNSNEPSRHP